MAVKERSRKETICMVGGKGKGWGVVELRRDLWVAKKKNASSNPGQLEIERGFGRRV